MANKIVKEIGKGFEIIGERLATIDQRLDVLEADSGGSGGPDFYGDTTMNETELKNRFKALETQVDAQRKFMKAGFVANETTDFDKAAENIGLCLLSGLEQSKPYALAELDSRGIETKAMAEGTLGGGGAVVPSELQAELINLIKQYGVFRPRVNVLPMGAAVVDVPEITSDITIYAPGEGGSITLGDPTLRNVKLVATKLAGLCKVSSEISEDTVIAVSRIVGESFARSLAKAEDQVGFLGDGTSTYYHMVGLAGALRAVDATIGNIAGLKVGTGNAYSELTLTDFEGVVALLPSEFDDAASWFMSKSFYYSVVWPLAVAAGVANIFEILSDRRSAAFLGYPVVFAPSMPSTEANSQICAILGDLRSGVYLGQRREQTLDVDGSVYFANDQIGIRVTERIAVNCFGVGDTTNPGPIVGLITAAA